MKDRLVQWIATRLTYDADELGKESHNLARCAVGGLLSDQLARGRDSFISNSLSAWRDQRLKRLLARLDKGGRQALRAIAPEGRGKKDVYRGPKL